MVFICPICKKKLEETVHTYRCENGHSYDVSAQGYVHLLPPNKMHSKIPGDNRQMVACRREFLETGLYLPFSNQLNDLVKEAIENKTQPVVVDAGCGEGYYTGRVKAHLDALGIQAEFAGFDISKFAVKAAAKKYRDIQFAVGSIFDSPIESNSADCLLNIFAPIVPEEFQRIVKRGSVMILAVPGARHLFGLKEILYERPYENEEKDTFYDGFAFQKRVTVKDEIYITQHDIIADLFAMTPYYWKTTIQGSERLKHTETLKTEIHFDFLVYQRI